MAALQPVRGTQDLLPDAYRRHRAVIDTARRIAERFGYQEIATPIFEFTEVFARPIGETTDIVSKEMYTFQDRGGEEITLRPEYTAGIVRAVMSNGLTQSLPLKFFAAGPMFRYERPQKGRFRQFHQIDAELIGAAQPTADVELISLAAEILDALGVLKHTVLELNTLGDSASRQAYRAALVDYYGAHRDRLSEDSRRRLETNPLRILDSKDEGDKRINAEAPSFADYLTPEAKDFFAEVCAGLTALGIGYALNPRLVRGLDYYCHTAFEFVTTSLGAQGTVLGGGRYDGLMGVMGGPETPGVGWAAGIERLALLIEEPPAPPRPIALVPLGKPAEMLALRLAQSLRQAGFHIELGYSGNLKRRLQRANKINARAAVILGDDEIAKQAAAVRDLDSGDQAEIPLASLAERLAAFR
ncbi:MAG TPA: histidine--tRNA ligase [Stellaceae bacterium]|jgi:histidyl-tRNA synthetase|nr:histidine--tRNA ligase [Stellaceae bacterium]